MKQAFVLIALGIFLAALTGCAAFLEDYNYSPVGGTSSAS